MPFWENFHEAIVKRVPLYAYNCFSHALSPYVYNLFSRVLIPLVYNRFLCVCASALAFGCFRGRVDGIGAFLVLVIAYRDRLCAAIGVGWLSLLKESQE